MFSEDSESYIKQLVLLGKVVTTFAAVVKIVYVALKSCSEAKAYFQETPEEELTRLEAELADLKKHYKEACSERQSHIPFFRPISQKEYEKRSKEDVQYKEKQEVLESRISELKEELDIQDRSCVIL